MGFDIECIVDIHSYPGEYFCPVCRTLVYPNEAFQAQCTHLYCKPCLAHIANGSRACPYDGYLVTEPDSKPLIESDKALAEKVGKVKVHCLYFRSGCTWEGTLSDCASHGSGCSFGNSPVICNRCGIQLVHRQVHDHAQICPGVFDGQQAIPGASGLSRSVTTTSTVTAVANQTAAQSGAPVSQAQNPPNVASTPLPGQNSNVQENANSQTPVAAPVAAPAPDQWYQQHYQQYYQQYVGYDPYQQQQQYYAIQQQPIQQYQQQQVQVQGQQQSHAYPQAPVQAQHQGHPQSHPQQQQHHQTPGQIQQQLPLQPQQVQQLNPVPQPPPQAHVQPQAQGQAQTQQQPQPHFQTLQGLPQVQQPPQAQAQAQAHVQALAPNYQVNTQQQPHPAMRPQTQMPPQVLPPPPPHSQSTQPSQYAQGIGMRPSSQHTQMPQYHPSHAQTNHSQAPQVHVPPQMHPQPHPYPQSSNQSNVQIPPQHPYQSQSQPIFHPQFNQTGAPATGQQVPHPPAPPVGGHHSYQQPLPAQKMQSGAPQHPMQPHPAGGSFHPGQAHGQAPQQPAPMRPPQPYASISQQQPSTVLPPQSQVPGAAPAPIQQFLPQGPQPTYPTQHRPPVQSVQQVPPQNYAQQQQFLAPFQGQMHQQGHLPPQHPMQSQMQMRPSGPPQPQQSQSYIGTPMIPNQGTHPESHPLSYGGFGPLAPSGPAQPASTQTSVNQNYAQPTEQNATVQEIKSPSKGPFEKDVEGQSLKEEGGTRQNGTVLKDSDNAGQDGLIKPVIKQEIGDMKGVSETSGGKSCEAGGADDKFCKKEVNLLADSLPLKPADLENQMKLSKTAVAGQSSSNYDRQSLPSLPASSTEGNLIPPKFYGTHQERSQAQVEGQPSSAVGPQGPANPPHHGQSLNLTEGKASSNFGGPPRSFESQFGPQGSELTSIADPRSTTGRAPPRHVEGHYGSQHVVRPSEVMMPRDQVSGSGEGPPLIKPHPDEPKFLRGNGGTAPDSSMFGSREGNLKPLSREQLNFFSREQPRPLDQASRSHDKQFHGPNYDAGSKLDSGALGTHSRFLPHRPSGGHSHGDAFGSGPEFGQQHVKPFSYQSPAGDYLGSPPRGLGGPSSFPRGTMALDDFNSREAHRFGEGSRSFNLSSDPVGNSFRDGVFPPLPGHLRRGDIDGPGNPRFGEHRPPALIRNHIGTDDVFGQDGSGHSTREKISGPGYLPGQFNMGETGPGTFPGHGHAGEATGNFPRPPFSESGRDVAGFLPSGNPAGRSNYPFHCFPNAGKFSGGMDSIDQSRKRRPPSTGWCRICEFDCETVEGLEMHSQTREHQNMAMDIVKSIKRQNKKKQRASGGRMVNEGGSRSRKVGTAGRGSKT